MAELSRSTAAGALVKLQSLPELPLLCSRCLETVKSDRLVRDSRGSECMFCNHPFPTYRWRQTAGPKSADQTMICDSCAKSRNACQSCMQDIVYHFPLHYRDLVYNAVAEEGGQEQDIVPALEAVSAEFKKGLFG